MPTQNIITVRIKNPEDVARKEGGALGKLLALAAPKLVEDKVLDAAARKFAEEMQSRGIDAEVAVVSSAPRGVPERSDFWRGAAVGAGSVGAGYVLYRIVSRLIGGRR